MPPKESPARKPDETKDAAPETVDAIGVCLMIVFEATIAALSLAMQSPVYGSIPAAAHHSKAVAASIVLGFLSHYFRKGKGTTKVLSAIVVAVLPLLSQHYFMSDSSDSLGPTLGPLVQGLYTCYVWVALAAYAAGDTVSLFQLDEAGPSWIDYILAGGIHTISVFYFYNVFNQQFLPALFSTYNASPLSAWAVLNPTNLQAVLLPVLAGIAQRKRPGVLTTSGICLVLALTLPLTSSQKSFGTTGLASQWQLLDKIWSNTGYISVLENTVEDYRVLRCDHSLLGGEWTASDQRRQDQKWKVNEPIYHVFEMLEAVRLVKTTPQIVDKDAKALVVGLGIGTAPKALIEHGINTTVVELDPAVHRFATKYFDLPIDHTAILEDAVKWTARTAQHDTSVRYDYVIHDVFTGGAEPLALFTHTFITNLRKLLTTNGVAAINYAGETSLPLTRKILHTIDSVFEGRCRAFSDNDPKESETAFLNMVVFCRNSPGLVEFRKPNKGDFLDSISRSHYLLPRPEHEVPIPGRTDEDNIELFRDHEVNRWNKQQLESALRHWKIMREIVPSRVWTAH